ncbi:uncharacterized protein [Asterias amurensis]|uniref:uncharacterized protein isoform X1 n=1 Tax=Asterias amurensis TaxID=7602 RepID=UPI003AB7A2C8
MGNRGNWYQQNLSPTAPPNTGYRMHGGSNAPSTTPNNCPSRDSNTNKFGSPYFDRRGAFTHHGRPAKEISGWEGPPPVTSALSSVCWAANGIQRNTPQRRSWPSQTRQSTRIPSVHQHQHQQTTIHRENTVNLSPSRQVQSQTTHHRIQHPNSRNLRRSKTCAEFAYAGQTHRGDGLISTLPEVHRNGTTSREGTAFFTTCNGLHERTAALKSLSSNPKLQVETVNGTTRIFRTQDRRPRSLPSKFSESPQSDIVSADFSEPQEKVIYVSKHGYHPRSKSPTYPVLIGTKDTLNLALCKKLWRIRRDLEGRKARENSVIFSEVSQSVHDDSEAEKWYEIMFDEHEQDDEEDDHDMTAIESLRLANEEGEFAQLDESISTQYPRPRVDLHFDRKYLKEHINDWAILGIDIEEEELKTGQRLRTASVARPTSAQNGRKPRVPTQTTTRVKISHRESSLGVKKVAKDRQENRVTKLPAVPTARRAFHAKNNHKKKGKKTKKPHLAVDSDDELLPALMNGDRDSRTPSPTLEFPPHEPNPELDDIDRRKSLVSKYLNSPSPNTNRVEEPIQTEPKPEDDAVKPPEPDEDKPKELTEKEKFVMMRKRMDERKAVMQKRREDFMDFSMLGIKSQRRRTQDGGAPAGGKNSLGSLMSTRLESMATFKTRKYRGEEVDDDDEDDDDDDDDEDESDGEGVGSSDDDDT